jgi:hypothetical protein
MMIHSIEPNALGVVDSRGFSCNVPHTIKSTGTGKFWKRMLDQLSNKNCNVKKPKLRNVEQKNIGKSDTLSNSNQISEPSTTKQKNENGKSSSMNRGFSNGYYLMEGNKQVCFEVSSTGDSSPYTYMSVFNYDVCPLFVGRDECLIKIEVSGHICFVDSLSQRPILTLG